MPCQKYTDLWTEVLIRAMEDLKSQNYVVRSKARGWFNNTHRRDIGSFLWICEIIDIDSDFILKGLKHVDKVLAVGVVFYCSNLFI